MAEIEKKELSMEELDQVSGGVIRKVNTGTNDKAQVRSSPTTGGPYNRMDSLVNGTEVDTVDDTLVWDPVSCRHFVEISYTNSKGVEKTGWIASSLVGLPR